jgi:hypothetical protein
MIEHHHIYIAKGQGKLLDLHDPHNTHYMHASTQDSRVSSMWVLVLWAYLAWLYSILEQLWLKILG